MLTADRPAVGRSAQSGFTLRPSEPCSSPSTRSAPPGKTLTVDRAGTEQAPGDPPPEPLGFPSEWLRSRSGSLLTSTLEGAAVRGKGRLSTPVDNSVRNLWAAPPGAVDRRGNTV
ncbi:hypothetical protein GCM10009534_65570 [Kribbella sandramycini]